VTSRPQDEDDATESTDDVTEATEETDLEKLLPADVFPEETTLATDEEASETTEETTPEADEETSAETTEEGETKKTGGRRVKVAVVKINKGSKGKNDHHDSGDHGSGHHHSGTGGFYYPGYRNDGGLLGVLWPGFSDDLDKPFISRECAPFPFQDQHFPRPEYVNPYHQPFYPGRVIAGRREKAGRKGKDKTSSTSVFVAAGDLDLDKGLEHASAAKEVIEQHVKRLKPVAEAAATHLRKGIAHASAAEEAIREGVKKLKPIADAAITDLKGDGGAIIHDVSEAEKKILAGKHRGSSWNKNLQGAGAHDGHSGLDWSASHGSSYQPGHAGAYGGHSGLGLSASHGSSYQPGHAGAYGGHSGLGLSASYGSSYQPGHDVSSSHTIGQYNPYSSHTSGQYNPYSPYTSGQYNPYSTHTSGQYNPYSSFEGYQPYLSHGWK